MTRYAIQTRLTNGEWEHAEFSEDEPVFHDTKASAEEELANHIASMEGAVEDGHLSDFTPEDWRVAPVE